MNGQQYLNYKDLMSDPVGRPASSPSLQPAPVTLCSVCWSTWGPGQAHNCTRQVKRTNVEELVRATSRKTKQQIGSSQLKEVFEEQGVTAKGGTATLSTGGAPLSTGGAPLSATLGKPRQKPEPKFSNDSLTKLQLKVWLETNYLL